MAVLVTGHRGLIGTALCAALPATVGLDLVEGGDVRNPDDVVRAIENCEGVVHLAAVSRVIAGERDPALCEATNVGGLRTLLAHLGDRWLVFASSREVYGQLAELPAREDAPLAPLNVYGRTKVAGEAMVAAAGGAILRLSNVYGGAADYPDRVVPAFARAALAGHELRVDGGDHAFDFTYLDDTIAAIVAVVEQLRAGAPAPPPIHVLTGVPTTLRELALLAVELAGTRAPIVDAPPRTFDVERFYGDPSRARALLGWQPRVPIRDGLARLIRSLDAK